MSKTTHVMANPQAALELLNGYSLEMTGKDVPGLMEAKDSIPAGTKINVTFLGNEDLEMRVSAAKAVRDLGFVPRPSGLGQGVGLVGPHRRLIDRGHQQRHHRGGGQQTSWQGNDQSGPVHSPHRSSAQAGTSFGFGSRRSSASRRN